MTDGNSSGWDDTVLPFQLDNSDIRKVNGTGLGLNISKRIVLAHGGTIDFSPNGEQGTTFFVDLARLQVEPETGAVVAAAVRSAL